LGDFDDDGRLDLVSGSNCCDPETVHLFLGRAGGTFADRREIKFERPGLDPTLRLLARGTTRPLLRDWNRDGRTDLVIGYVGSTTLLVSAGPLAGKTTVKVEPVALPKIPNANPVYFGVADWDDDGAFDLLAAMQYREAKDHHWSYGVYWFRNTSAQGEPTFAPPSRLLALPRPWELNAFAVVDDGRGGVSGLVVSMVKDWKRNPKGGGWSGVSHLRLYRRKR
jgi:hypothetical protein